MAKETFNIAIPKGEDWTDGADGSTLQNEIKVAKAGGHV